jgi:hypothetical protein
MVGQISKHSVNKHFPPNFSFVKHGPQCSVIQLVEAESENETLGGCILAILRQPPDCQRTGSLVRPGYLYSAKRPVSDVAWPMSARTTANPPLKTSARQRMHMGFMAFSKLCAS